MPAPSGSGEDFMMQNPAGRRRVRPDERRGSRWGPLHLRRYGRATGFFARAFGDVLPLGLVVVRLGAQARTRVLRGAAVVLSGLGDAIAFFLAGLRGHRLRKSGRGDTEGEDAGDGGVNRGLVVHREISSWKGRETGTMPIYRVGRSRGIDLTERFNGYSIALRDLQPGAAVTRMFTRPGAAVNSDSGAWHRGAALSGVRSRGTRRTRRGVRAAGAAARAAAGHPARAR